MAFLDWVVFPVVGIAAFYVLRKLFKDDPHKGCKGCSATASSEKKSASRS